jgi:hypothetical protein
MFFPEGKKIETPNPYLSVCSKHPFKSSAPLQPSSLTMSSAAAIKPFTMNPDAPAFIPAALREEAVPHIRPITIMLDREVRVFPMREPRTESLQSNVLTWIGTRTEGPSEKWTTYGVEGGEPSRFAGEEDSPFICDKDTLDEYGENTKVYTMACHDNDYRLSACLRSMPGFADPTPEQLGDFPKNIQHYYWISDGKNDEHPWRALIKLTTGLFVYITASCAFSGFDCEGNIHVYGSESLQTLIDHGMAEDARQRFGRIFNRPSKGSAAAPAGSAGAGQLNRPSKTVAAGGGGGPRKPAAKKI